VRRRQLHEGVFHRPLDNGRIEQRSLGDGHARRASRSASAVARRWDPATRPGRR
jgi:hypothetical protein